MSRIRDGHVKTPRGWPLRHYWHFHFLSGIIHQRQIPVHHLLQPPTVDPVGIQKSVGTLFCQNFSWKGESFLKFFSLLYLCPAFPTPCLFDKFVTVSEWRSVMHEELLRITCWSPKVSENSSGCCRVFVSLFYSIRITFVTSADSRSIVWLLHTHFVAYTCTCDYRGTTNHTFDLSVWGHACNRVDHKLN